MKLHILTLAASALMLASCTTDSAQRREKTNDSDRYNNTNLDKPPGQTDGVGTFLKPSNGAPSTPENPNPNETKPIDNPVPPAPPTTPTTPEPAPPTPPAPAVNNASSIPYGKPVPGKKGFVTSPFDPAAGMIDVRDIAPGTKVKDPYTGKVFLVP